MIFYKMSIPHRGWSKHCGGTSGTISSDVYHGVLWVGVKNDRNGSIWQSGISKYQEVFNRS